MVVLTRNPSTREAETGGSLGATSWPAQPTWENSRPVRDQQLSSDLHVNTHICMCVEAIPQATEATEKTWVTVTLVSVGRLMPTGNIHMGFPNPDKEDSLLETV